MSKPRTRLGAKFVILVAAILSVTLGASATWLYSQQQQLLEEQLIERAKALNNFVSLISSEAILSYDFVALESYMQDITEKRDIVFSLVVDPEGQPLTTYIDNSSAEVKALGNGKPFNSVLKLMEHAKKSPNVILQRFPIIQHDKRLGTFIVGISRTRLDQRITEHFIRLLLAYSAIIGFLSIAIYLIFRYNVMKPVRELMDGSKRIASGNYDKPARVVSDDELGLLTESFNNMMSDVRTDRDMLNFQANYDSLTGLPNRMQALERLENEIARAKREHRKFSVIFIDLNNFKLINDTMGHNAGDALLVELSERFTSTLRESDTIARLGGDEFLLILPATGKAEEVKEAATRLNDTLHEPLHIEDREVFIQCSMGIAIFPNDGHSTKTLMANADNAMYQAKLSKDENVRFFAPEMNQEILARLTLEHDLHLALQHNEFELYFQPIVDASTLKLLGAEALLRWFHPEKGLISPEQFIPVAEATGRIIPIGTWVLNTVANAINKLTEQGIDPGYITVNVSRMQLNEDFEPIIHEILDRTGISPEAIRLEVTESALMENYGDVPKILHRLNNQGIKLVLDDFGTGFSSLSYLKHFPFKVLKIDKSFVDDLPEDEDDASLVRGIIAMGRSLGIDVVAEGVEQEKQLRFLQDAMVDSIQGYLMSKPMPLDEYRKYLIRKIHS